MPGLIRHVDTVESEGGGVPSSRSPARDLPLGSLWTSGRTHRAHGFPTELFAWRPGLCLPSCGQAWEAMPAATAHH